MKPYRKGVISALFSFLILLVISASVLAGGMGSGDGSGSEQYEDAEGQNGDGSQSGYTRMFGDFELNGDTVGGTFLTFDFDGTGLYNYTVSEDPEMVLGSIVVTGPGDVDLQASIQGAIFRSVWEDVTITAHNNPSGLLRVDNRGQETCDLVVELAEGITFGTPNNGTIPLVGSEVGAMISLAGSSYLINGTVLEIDLAEDQRFLLIIGPEQFRYQTKVEEAVLNGLIEGNIDGQMKVCLGEDDQGEGQHFPVEGKAQMTLKQVQAGECVKLEVRSEEKAGKVFAFSISGEVFPREVRSRVRLMFDGEEAQNREKPEDVIGSSEKDPSYCMEEDAEGNLHGVFLVPEFSSHEISLELEDEEKNDSGAPYFFLAIVVAISLGAVAYVIFRRKR